METVSSMLKKKKECKNAIEGKGCKLVYNRAVGGYQVIKGTWRIKWML